MDDKTKSLEKMELGRLLSWHPRPL